MKRNGNYTLETELAYGKGDAHIGIDKLEYFTGIAMQGLLAQTEWPDHENLAEVSVSIAKAVINELNRV